MGVSGQQGVEWIPCCCHCGCPEGLRVGHDSMCAGGCNDLSDEATVKLLIRIFGNGE